jgi:hypothetical protein
MDAEQKHEERPHRRAAADASKSDQCPDGKPGEHLKRIDMVQES